MIRKEAWSFYRTISGVCLCWELEEAKGPKNGSAAILCTGGPDVIRKEAWPFYRTIPAVRLCWELEEAKGPKGVSAVLYGLAGELIRSLSRNAKWELGVRGATMWV